MLAGAAYQRPTHSSPAYLNAWYPCSSCIPPLLTAKYLLSEKPKTMYLSILVLCVNLLAAFPQTWAQPLRHHLTLRASHRHHMGLHHHLSAPRLSTEGLGQHIFSFRSSDTPSQMDLDPRHNDNANFQNLKLSHGLTDS